MLRTGDLPALTCMALLLVLAYLVNMVATRFQIYLVSRTGQQILAKLRNEVFAASKARRSSIWRANRPAT